MSNHILGMRPTALLLKWFFGNLCLTLNLVLCKRIPPRHYLQSSGIVGFIWICLPGTCRFMYFSLVFVKFRLNLNLTMLGLGLVWAELLPSYIYVYIYLLFLYLKLESPSDFGKYSTHDHAITFCIPFQSFPYTP